MPRHENRLRILEDLRAYGFIVEMDDFGTGYSSLNMISSLPIDALKLDMSFVRNAFGETRDVRMIELIIDIADYLHVPVVAEGVETEEQYLVLKAMGCDLVQGYYFSRPVPPEEFDHFLSERSDAAVAVTPERKKTYLSISKALTGDFEHIYYVDVVTDYYLEFRTGADGTLEDVRRSIFTSSCWRSLGFIVAGTIVLWLYAAKRLKALPTVAAIAVVCLADLWTVNKNYLNDSMFRDASIKEKTHQKTALDNFLLEDRTPDYRVLNMPYPTERLSTVFNENQTSYYHQSVGGYHAAKLQRYQDLIDSCLYREMSAINQIVPQAAYQLDSLPTDQFMPVLNMLNTRYVVVRTQEGIWPMLNSQAYGNAWFVDNIRYVGNANEELSALHQLELRHEAVADKRFEQVLGQPAALDSATTVQPAELGRVNYVLRAMHIDGGKHQVELSFNPQSVKTTETVAYISLVVTALLILAAIALGLKRRKTIDKKS